VIGYVGHTGDTSANHDHFEWHPDGGPAVDPYDFLMKVC
jgi:murein DD-endopeptidase MepM/ murein hydrolase activator NlpD